MNLFWPVTVIALGCVSPGFSAEKEIDFNRDIRPILSGKCFACHGPDEEERAADLRLDTEPGSRFDLGGYAAVVPGDIEKSELIFRVTTDDDSDVMPPPKKGNRLSSAEIETLKTWVKQGGKYDQHWAYQKPVRPTEPKSAHQDWTVLNPIDSFVHKKLASKGLKPSPPAGRLALARRVAMDLTGLPPTWEEAQAFVKDPSDNAFEKYVDSLLAEPSFGERWAQMWLDLARYADSAGYADDPPRTIWAYRDWVIRAFNANKPFDQFTIEQIAGDLLQKPTDDQLIATAFHRNTLTNSEGGTNDEEFRNVAIVDRVNTTMEVWMGTTMACAQCHTHKFDPITQDEYFQMFDFFNQSEDTDKKDERPLHEVWTAQQIADKEAWKKEITELKTTLGRDTPLLAKARDQWLAGLSQEPKWDSLSLHEAKGANLTSGPDNWIALEGDKPENAVYMLNFPTAEKQITGLRIEISPQQKSNFVLSQIKASWKPKESKTLDGRFVRVELPGTGKMIHLAELEVFSNGTNVALSGKASQSSTGFDGPAKLANDGNTDGDYAKKSVSHTAVQKDPWFEIDLGKTHPIDFFTIWNRTGTNLEQRLAGYRVKILDESRNIVWEQAPSDVPKPSTKFAMSGAMNIPLAAAFASHQQSGFPASSVLTAKPGKKMGWAISEAVGKPVKLTLTLPKSLSLKTGIMTLRLAQSSELKSHVLTNFRVSTTSNTDLTEWSRMTPAIRSLVKKADRTPAEDGKIAAFHRTIAPQLAPQRKQLAALETRLKNAKPSTTVPIMNDLSPEKERITKVHLRGSYQNTGNEVKRGVPVVFHSQRKDLPNNRLALANWLIDPENPLTARVIVNRFWGQIFGIGIVPTSEEFGSQGELPTHPELLDWLAVEFQESGWDIKHLLKLMVTSATYRQESTATPELIEADPQNQFYARGPRFRVGAEMIRDQALFVSGLLSKKMYGPPVKPPQPNLGLRAAFGGSTDWKTSAGEDKFRRGIYTTWRRSSPYPSMATFDAPNREICISRRGRTNTPLQALVTLNDPVYVEAAQALARDIISRGGQSVEEKIRFGWRTVLIRDPNPGEVERMAGLIKNAVKSFSGNPNEATKMATEPIGAAPEGIPIEELAAWTVAGNVLLNLDELFLKR